MRILFLSRYQDRLNRGAENFVENLSKRLSKNHQVEIFEGKGADNFSNTLGKYDLVIPINGGLQSLKASLGRIARNYKLLITGHSGIGRDDIWNIAVCKPDVFVALTDFMADWAKKWAWGSKVVKIPNGVDLNKFRPIGEKKELDLPKPIILSAGALVWYKYHEQVIDALARITVGSLLIVGEGPLENKLKKKGEEKLKRRFMISNFKYEDMPKVYRSCDFFTLPSWNREAFGLVYLEAMASGLPVVAPDDSSRREIIGEAGIFVDTSDSEKYAKAIMECLNRNWKNEPRKQAEKFSWDETVKQYEKVFLNLS